MMMESGGPPDAPAAAPRRRGRPPRGTHAPGAQRAEEFLAIAVDVIWRNGYAGTRMGDIADACGVAKASLYHHFRSKDEIYARVVENLCRLFERETRLGGAGSALERMEAFLRCRVEVVLGHREELAVFNRDLLRIKGEVGQKARDVAMASWIQLRGILIDGQREGTFRIAHPDASASMILGCLSFLPTWQPPASTLTDEQCIGELVISITRGMMTDRARANAATR